MSKTTTTKQASVPTHMLPIGDLYLASEAPKGVDLQVRDSGRGSPLTDAELKASIYSNGIIVPLIWKLHADRRYIVAGNRRLRFLREIFADAIASVVPTQNVADYPGNWRDIAMDTNLALPPHVVERYEMIAAIAKEEKLPEAEVCKRYGMSDGQYRRVMALAKMAPVVRQAWKESKIDAKTAQAFTLTDPDEQAKIFAAIEKANGRVTDWIVRQKIIPATQQEVGKMVAFVGIEAVRAAKLLKQEDLFGNDHIVSDIKGLKKLVGDKFAKVRDALVKAGWGWAITSDQLEAQEYQYGDLHPDPKKAKMTSEEKKRSDEITKLLTGDARDDMDSEEEDALIEEQEGIEQAVACRGFSEAQMAKAGCILKIGHAGELKISYGKVKPAEKAKAAASERRAAAPAEKAKKKPNKPGEVALTNALAQRLSQQLEKAISEAMPSAPYVCIAALIAGFATRGDVINVDVGKEPNHNYRHRNDISKNWLQVFEGALKASPEEQAVMLAAIAAPALDIQVTYASHKQPADNKGLQRLAEALPKDVVNSLTWRNFDIAGYFGSVNQQTCVDAVRAGMGDEHAAKVAKMKKADAAKFAATNLKPLGYLPPAIRTVHYAGPQEKVAAKPSAPAKKTAKKKAKAKK